MRTLGQVTLTNEDNFPLDHFALYSSRNPDVKEEARGQDNLSGYPSSAPVFNSAVPRIQARQMPF
jgi:hypothetical protein